MANPIVLFRCDASPQIGAGHVTRCMALAEAMHDSGWRVIFAVGPETVAIVPTLAAGRFAIRECRTSADTAPERLAQYASGQADLLVVDHYGLDVAFEQACRLWADRILVLDDGTGRRHDCDFLVDAAMEDAGSYSALVPSHAQLLLGPKFALIRPTFADYRRAASARRDGRAVGNILISFGATDPSDATNMALDALVDLQPAVAITIALSSQGPHIDAVRRRLDARTRLVEDFADIGELMVEADLAIGAAGATAFERAVVGLPSIMVTLADNQRNLGELMSRSGAAVEAGTPGSDCVERVGALVRALIEDKTRRLRMSEAACQLIDGRGARRVIMEILQAASDADAVRLRLADIQDESWLLELQREPETRRYSRNTAAPSLDEHCRWMRRTVANPDTLLMIIESHGHRAGMLRLDRLQTESGRPTFEVSVAITPSDWRRGIASRALAVVRRMFPRVILEATILTGNDASKRLFTNAGYVLAGDNVYRNSPVSP